jgi:predicted nucleotidyltransferase component of viral defense system
VLLRDFTLVGGTALAVQIGHRRSEDLDFWLPRERLDKKIIAEIIYRAKDAGLDPRLTTPHHQISAAKINGVDLLEYAQDFMIGGAKVTFFSRYDIPFRYFDTLLRVQDATCSFRIMGEEGLFAMKAHVIHRRVRSRDLFDLKTFLGHGKTLDEVFLAASTADPACSPEYTSAVLVGEVPLDKQDEGFDSIGVTETIQDVYAFFRAVVNEYEQVVAKQTLEDIGPEP